MSSPSSTLFEFQQKSFPAGQQTFHYNQCLNGVAVEFVDSNNYERKNSLQSKTVMPELSNLSSQRIYAQLQRTDSSLTPRTTNAPLTPNQLIKKDSSLSNNTISGKKINREREQFCFGVPRETNNNANISKEIINFNDPTKVIIPDQIIDLQQTWLRMKEDHQFDSRNKSVSPENFKSKLFSNNNTSYSHLSPNQNQIETLEIIHHRNQQIESQSPYINSKNGHQTFISNLSNGMLANSPLCGNFTNKHSNNMRNFQNSYQEKNLKQHVRESQEITKQLINYSGIKTNKNPFQASQRNSANTDQHHSIYSEREGNCKILFDQNQLNNSHNGYNISSCNNSNLNNLSNISAPGFEQGSSLENSFLKSNTNYNSTKVLTPNIITQAVPYSKINLNINPLGNQNNSSSGNIGQNSHRIQSANSDYSDQKDKKLGNLTNRLENSQSTSTLVFNPMSQRSFDGQNPVMQKINLFEAEADLFGVSKERQININAQNQSSISNNYNSIFDNYQQANYKIEKPALVNNSNNFQVTQKSFLNANNSSINHIINGQRESRTPQNIRDNESGIFGQGNGNDSWISSVNDGNSNGQNYLQNILDRYSNIHQKKGLDAISQTQFQETQNLSKENLLSNGGRESKISSIQNSNPLVGDFGENLSAYQQDFQITSQSRTSNTSNTRLSYMGIVQDQNFNATKGKQFINSIPDQQNNNNINKNNEINQGNLMKMVENQRKEINNQNNCIIKELYNFQHDKNQANIIPQLDTHNGDNQNRQNVQVQLADRTKGSDVQENFGQPMKNGYLLNEYMNSKIVEKKPEQAAQRTIKTNVYNQNNLGKNKASSKQTDSLFQNNIQSREIKSNVVTKEKLNYKLL